MNGQKTYGPARRSTDKMDVRSVFLGSKLKILVTALGVVTASVGGAFVLGLVGAPSVVAVENRFGPVSERTTIVETDLVVHNPNPIGVRLGDTTVTYTVNMNDVAMASGRKEGLRISPGNTTLEFRTAMRNGKIPDWWVTHIENGEETNVTIDATVQSGLLGNRTFDIRQRKQVTTNIIGQFNSDETRPVRAQNPPPTVENPILYINQTRASWGAVTQQETPINMGFTVYNPHLKPYVITEVGYTITMNGIRVGEGATDEKKVIPGGSTATIEPTTVIRNGRLDEWWVSHLKNDQVTHLRIDFYAKVELPTGNTIRVPLNDLTYEKRIETDIFGNKESSTGGNATSSTPTPTPTPTDGGLVGTDSPVSTPTDGGLVDTPTATPTATSTGDDLV